MVSHYNLIFLRIKCDSGFSLTFPSWNWSDPWNILRILNDYSKGNNAPILKKARLAKTHVIVGRSTESLVFLIFFWGQVYVTANCIYWFKHSLFTLRSHFPPTVFLNWTCLESKAVVRSKTNLDCGLFARFPKLYFVRASNVQITRDYCIQWIKSYFLKEHKFVCTSDAAMMEGGRLFLK